MKKLVRELVQKVVGAKKKKKKKENLQDILDLNVAKWW